MAVVRNLMVRAGADFSGMRKEMVKANKSVASFKKGVIGALKIIGGAYVVKKVVDYGRASVREYNAAAVAAAKLGQVMRNTMDATEDQIQSIKELAAAQQRIGVVHSDIQLAGGQELGTYLSQVNSLKTLLPVLNNMLAQQYGLDATAENAVQIGTMIGKVMDGQLGALSRYGYSWTKSQEQILKFGDEAQRAATLAAVVNQSVGGMNEALAKTPQGQMKQLAMTFADIKAQVGQGIMPILQRVLPYIQAVANSFLRAAQYVSAFTAALFGAQEVQKQADAVGALGDAYDEAGKKAKGSVASFDQINTVGDKAENTDVNGLVDGLETGGGFGLFDRVGEQMSEVAERARAMADKVRSIYSTLSSFMRQHSELIIAGLAGVTTAFTAMWIAANGGAMAKGATKILSSLGALASPMGIIAAAIAAVVAGGVLLWKNWDELSTKWKILGTVLLGGVGIIVAVGKNFKWIKDNVLIPLGNFLSSVLMTAIGGMTTALIWLWKNAVGPLAVELGSALYPAIKAVSDIAKAFWQLVLVPLGKAMKEGFVAAVTAANTVLRTLLQKAILPLATSLGNTLKPVITVMGNAFIWLMNNALKPLVSFMSGNVVRIFTEAFRSIGGLIEGLKMSFIGLMNFITGVFTGDWAKAWNGVRDIFKGVFDSLYSIVKFPLNLIIDAINTVISGLNKIALDIPDWVPDSLGGGKKFGISIPKIPKLATGTNYVARDGLAFLHEGEAVVPKEYNPAIGGGGDNKELIAELRAIRAAVKDLKSIQAVISQSEVYRSAVEGIKNHQRRTGELPFPV